MLLSRSVVGSTGMVVVVVVASGLELGTVAMTVYGGVAAPRVDWHVRGDVLVAEDADPAAALGGAPDLALVGSALVLSCCQFTVTGGCYPAMVMRMMMAATRPTHTLQLAALAILSLGSVLPRDARARPTDTTSPTVHFRATLRRRISLRLLLLLLQMQQLLILASTTTVGSQLRRQILRAYLKIAPDSRRLFIIIGLRLLRC